MSPRAALVALLLATVPLAGCIGGDDSLNAANVDPDAALGTASAIVHSATGKLIPSTVDVGDVTGLVVPVGHIAIEPTLSATKDGVLFYAAATFENPQIPTGDPYTDILRSEDGGLTWEVVTAKLPTGQNNPPLTGDPYVHVDADTSRVFSLDMYHLACSWITFSDDLGESWLGNPVACGLPPGVHDHQTMTTAKPRVLQTVGYPNLVYYCVNRVADSACAISVNGGLTFGALRPLIFKGLDPEHVQVNTTTPEGPLMGALEGLCGGLHGHVAAAPDGTVYLPKEHCGKPAVAFTQDDGLTWEVSVVNDELGAFGGPDPSVAIDEAGNVHYIWIDAMGFTRLATSVDGGRTWGQPLNLTAPGLTATGLATLAAGASGKVAFAYVGTDIPGGYAENREDEDWDNATWTGYLGYVEDALATDPVVVTVPTNSPGDPLVRGRCGDVRCPGMFDFIDVIITADGRPYAAFVDACIETCATPEGTPDDNLYSDAPGVVMTLATGRSLVDGTPLQPIAAPPVA